MSRFFRALEQAEHERVLRLRAHGAAAVAVAVSPDGEPPRAPASLAPPVPSAPAGDRRAVAEHLVSLVAPSSFAAEQYRSLRHLVEKLHETAELSVVAVSSPAVGDGKTTTAINLAGALAQAPEARVLVVDADLRQPSLARDLGMHDPDRPGLVDAILDPTYELEAVARERRPFNLSVVPAGRASATPYEVLQSPRLGELLAQARQEYDFVVIDTSPLVSVPDCRVIGRWVDGFLVVVRAHKTPRKLIEEAVRVIDAAKIIGIVFNGGECSMSGYSGAAAGLSFHADARRRWTRAVKRAGKIGVAVGGRFTNAPGTIRRRLKKTLRDA